MLISVSSKLGRYNNIGLKLYSKYLYSKRSIINIPVIINNFNRYTCLVNLVEWLEESGLNNIFIIDNCSTYSKLLEYYKKTNHIVFRLNQNIGHLSLWKTHLFRLFRKDYYIYTDPDILPINECPSTFLKYFLSILDNYPEYDKVGFGLKIDDLPDSYVLKKEVVSWEKQYWEKEIASQIFDAKIDTTFALYRPGKAGGAELSALRTGFPYIARHVPWYLDADKLSEEEMYYLEHANLSSTWYKRITKDGKYELIK
jgi:hypothetical protein